MDSEDNDTDILLKRVDDGDIKAIDELFDRHRSRLRRMINVRLDARVSPRLEPSDVIQETLLVASQKLPRYLVERPIPFYPWLRRICWERLVDLHDRHVVAKKRSVHREVGQLRLADKSAMQLIDRIVGAEVSPSKNMVQAEIRERVRLALGELPSTDREILVMRFLEELSLQESADALGISEGAVSMRQLRALLRLRSELGGEHE